jgi:hypothetical protein
VAFKITTSATVTALQEGIRLLGTSSANFNSTWCHDRGPGSQISIWSRRNSPSEYTPWLSGTARSELRCRPLRTDTAAPFPPPSPSFRSSPISRASRANPKVGGNGIRPDTPSSRLCSVAQGHPKRSLTSSARHGHVKVILAGMVADGSSNAPPAFITLPTRAPCAMGCYYPSTNANSGWSTETRLHRTSTGSDKRDMSNRSILPRPSSDLARERFPRSNSVPWRPFSRWPSHPILPQPILSTRAIAGSTNPFLDDYFS